MPVQAMSELALCCRSDTSSVPMPRTPSICEEDQEPASGPRHKHARSLDDLDRLRSSLDGSEVGSLIRFCCPQAADTCRTVVLCEPA